ncbi:zonular occludens toxin domain-containing protein [Methylomonas koyamae]|uniref:zonular occludens toxin domain-containing protein n=1 Tax=Methylomonas koyamae TaxID=702114 RepID=UPI00112B2247|nr:zonular occludens toxin domain-containing protein [Methylomonas koyamae]TPQ24989.1 hypothetical protein C2U68_17060 [Methylomonas koyamae]
MPGWIIQGVRGEGKSLCAVHKARDYLLRGRPVATNLDIFPDGMLPDDNGAIVYRLPDCPRYVDFAMLPNAFDPKYRGEDKNGLIILDELALWMNCRQWNEKGREKIIQWLLLSRKRHWDLILLCQDHEMIDSQLKTTCCDYLVQASRSDRKKIPYLGKFLEFFFISGYFPKWHQYDVYYGLTGTDTVNDTWRFAGTDVYDGYDTNQIFTDGLELVGDRVLDMRATYCYLPANYLSKQVYVDRLQATIDDIIDAKPLTSNGEPMAKAKTSKKDHSQAKAWLLLVALVVFLSYKYLIPKDTAAAVPAASAATSAPVPATLTPVQDKADTTGHDSANTVQAVNSPNAFLDHLIKSYRPRLSAFMSAKDSTGAEVFTGILEFYEGSAVVERFTITQLKALGCAVVVRPYGVDIVTSAGVHPVTAWPRSSSASNETVKPVLGRTVPLATPQPNDNLGVVASLGSLAPGH